MEYSFEANENELYVLRHILKCWLDMYHKNEHSEIKKVAQEWYNMIDELLE